MELIDAHVHLWDLSTHQWYPAMQDPDVAKTWARLGDISRMARDFLLEDYLAETDGCEVLALVHVEATTAPRAYLEEAAWLDQLLANSSVPVVTIGTVDATLPTDELRADLESQAAHERFRGARVLTGLDPSSRAADELCGWLAARDLVFDLVAHPADAPAVSAMLARHPDLDVVLEHAGWPDGTDADQRRAWRAAMSTLAANERVRCKISGIGMVTHTLQEAALRPWIEGCLDVFGVERCMFGGNFPVEAMYGTYAELIAGVRAVTDALASDEQHALFIENARRAYRL